MNLQQIATILKEFERILPNKNIHGVRCVDDLNMIYMMGIIDYLTATKGSKDYSTIHHAYSKWQPIELVCTQYVESFFLAVKLYSESTGEFGINPDQSAKAFI